MKTEGDKIVSRLALADNILQLVRESGLLRKKAGRRKMKRGRRKVKAIAPVPKAHLTPRETKKERVARLTREAEAQSAANG